MESQDEESVSSDGSCLEVDDVTTVVTESTQHTYSTESTVSEDSCASMPELVQRPADNSSKR